MRPILISLHAQQRMIARSATEQEVRDAISFQPWQPAQYGKYQVHRQSPYNQPSPYNQRTYAFKTVHVVFAVEEDRIVVVTVLVYYGNKEMIV